ncbi:MAG: YCF48-related protein [Lewinella sp.]
MKHASLYLFLLLLFASLSLTAQTENVVYPRNWETKFQDVYVDASGQGYAVGTCGVITRTTNAGMSWELVDFSESSLDYTAVTCPGDNCDNAIIMGDGVLLTRSGSTFSMDLNEDYQNVRKLHLLSNNVIIGDKNGENYLRSTDNGLNWTTLIATVSRFQGEFMNFYNGTEGYVFDSDKFLNKTTDGGLTWTRYDAAIAIDGSPLAMHWRDANNGWIQSSSQDIFRTTDGGLSWTNLAPPSKPRRMLWLESFSDTHLVCAGLVDEYWVSLDAGSTWTRDAFPSGSGTRPGFYNYHRRGDEFFVPSDAGEIFYSATNFENWEGQIPSDRVSLTEIAFANDDLGIVAGTGSALLKTTDGGDTWTPLVSGNSNPNAPVTAIDMRSETEHILYYANTFPRITRNGGSSYDWYFQEESGLGPGDAYAFHNFSNGDVFVMGQELAGKSSDDGATWTVIDHNFDRRINRLSFPTADIGFAAGDKVIAKTTDGGLTWTELTRPNETTRWEGVFFYNELRGIVSSGSSGSDGSVNTSRTYLTTDGGISWTQISGFAAGYGYKYDDATGTTYSASFASGNNALLSRSMDDGATWEIVARGCGAGRGVGLTPSGNFVYLAGDGGHIQRHETANIVSNRRRQVVTPSLAAYPNPTSGELNIELPSTSQPTTLEVFSADGRRVQTSVVPAGTERFRFVIDHQKTGLYLLSWRNANGVRHTGRVMVW